MNECSIPRRSVQPHINELEETKDGRRNENQAVMSYEEDIDAEEKDKMDD